MPPRLDSDLLEPPVTQSVGAALGASITCATNPAKIGGRHAREPVTYNGLDHEDMGMMTLFEIAPA